MVRNSTDIKRYCCTSLCMTINYTISGLTILDVYGFTFEERANTTPVTALSPQKDRVRQHVLYLPFAWRYNRTTNQSKSHVATGAANMQALKILCNVLQLKQCH